MDDFYHAWDYLSNHRMFINDTEMPHFQNALNIEVVKIDPRIDEINDNPDRNVKTVVWLECGGYDKISKAFTHDIRLDCEGDSFETAIINLAKLVRKYIGDK